MQSCLVVRYPEEQLWDVYHPTANVWAYGILVLDTLDQSWE